jgi:tetratricopeptide (TPR) repeat protein
LLEGAAATFRAAGEWASLVRVTAWVGRAYCQRGTLGEGIAALTALLQQLDRTAAAPPLGALYEALGRSLYITGRYPEALVASERAVELARGAGDDRTRVLADWLRVNLLILLGRLGDAAQAGREALPRAELLGDRLCLTQAHRYLAEIHLLRGALETSREHVARALATAEELGDPGQLSLAMSYRGWVALVRGEWRDAHAALERALELSGQVDGRLSAIEALLFRARLALAEGDWGTAAAAGGEATALAQGYGDLQGLRWASSVMAELEILEDHPDLAGARLRPLLDRPALEEGDVTALLPVLAWAHLELGQVEQAADALDQALTRARPEEMRLVLVEALRVQALVALRRGQREEAARSLAEGVTLARAMPYPYAEARLLHLDGLLHVQQGEPEAARERLEAALALFRRLGAHKDTEWVEQALAGLSQ